MNTDHLQGWPSADATLHWIPGRGGNPGVWHIVADCPYLDKDDRHYAKPHQHFHGGGNDEHGAYLGTREADCGQGVYELAKLPFGTQRKATR